MCQQGESWWTHPGPTHWTRLIRDIPDFPKPGIVFKDIMPVLADAAAFDDAIEALAAPWLGVRIDAVLAMEARGFLFGAPLARALGAGIVPLRKPGKLPGEKIGVDYALEYGTDRIELHTGQILPGQKVVLVDDLIATGGTALAGINLIRQAGGVVEQALFIVDLPELGGAEKLRAAGVVPTALIGFDGH